jgi:uncharacterized protein (TIGR03437 family)
MAATAQTTTPALFFSDIDSGPNTGGDNNAGVYVTIYGQRFGATQGGSYVEIGGGQAYSYPLWSDTKITFQLGPAAHTGNIVVTNGGGTSNGIPFTVRAGNIYFVSVSGSDSNSGRSGSPWLTLPNAVQSISAGDTIYAMNGVTQSMDDGQGWDAALTLREEWCGTSGYNRALLAYPNASVTIGNANGASPTSGLRSTDFSAGDGACGGYWTFGEIIFRGIGPVVVAGPSQQWRFIGNDISCPAADGSNGDACFETSQASGVEFLGNNVHDAGTVAASALFQGVYFSTDSNDIDMGWNTVTNVHGCRGVQFHSSPLGSGYPNSGYNQYNLQVHDNVIHDTQCDGLILDTVDPSKGAVSVYNNVIYNAGKGPNNPEESGDWACIYVPGTTENDTPGSGSVEIYNNTFYSCGTFSTPPYNSQNGGIVEGGANPNLYVSIRNNIFYQTSGEPYLVVWNPVSGEPCADSDNCPWVQGTNNLFYGVGTETTDTINVTNSINSDPQLVNPAAAEFQLKSNSPARSAGANTGVTEDLVGVPRGGSEGYDIGAYQYDSSHATIVPSLTAITDAASFISGSVSPGELIVCFGTNLGPATAAFAQVSNGAITNSLGGVQVLFNGVAAPLLYAQANQINAIVPYEAAGAGSVSVQVFYGGQTSSTLTVPVADTAPSIFTQGSSGYGQGAILDQNLSVNSIDNVTHPGNVIVIYATGAGQTNPPGVDGRIATGASFPPVDSPTVTVGGIPATVLYAGAAPGLVAGVEQLNVLLPANTPSGNAVPVVISAKGVSSQSPVTVAVQ